MGNGANCDYCENKCKCSLCSGKTKRPIGVVDQIKIITAPQHIHNTIDEAAIDAAYHIYRISSKDNDKHREYGITIYKNTKNDKFYLTDIKRSWEDTPQIDPDDNIAKPNGCVYVAHVHSHPIGDTTGQTFSLTDYIIYYKNRIIEDKLPGITGYLVSHINNIEFITSNNCVLKKAEHCKRCLIPNEPNPIRRKECEVCPVKCKECIKIKDEGNVRHVGMSPIPLIDKREKKTGALMRFIPPPAEEILREGYSTVTDNPKKSITLAKGRRVVADGQDGMVDEKLQKWNEINRLNNPNKEHFDSRRLRRCLFKKHVDVMPIVHVTAINNGVATWYSGRDIIFP